MAKRFGIISLDDEGSSMGDGVLHSGRTERGLGKGVMMDWSIYWLKKYNNEAQNLTTSVCSKEG